MSILTGLAGSTGMTTLGQLYGFASSAAQFAVEHIDKLKSADNLLANKCGLLLEQAVAGWGMGSETALLVIGIGQHLLGNPLTAGVVMTPGVNAVVVTCAALGAIHYGWKAMSDEDREMLVTAVGSAFAVGAELIRSIASFAYDKLKALMSAENMAELRKLVADVAGAFGTRLSEITRKLSDRIVERSSYAIATAGGAASAAWARVPALRRKDGS